MFLSGGRLTTFMDSGVPLSAALFIFHASLSQGPGAAGSNNKLLLIASEASEQRGSGGHAL